MKALAKKSTANQSKEYDLERHITMLSLTMSSFV